IHAVIYPSSRSYSPQPETNWLPHNSQHLAAAQSLASTTDIPPQPQIDHRSGEIDRSPSFDRDAPPQRTIYNNDQASRQLKPVQNRPSAPGDIVSAPVQESSLAQL